MNFPPFPADHPQMSIDDRCLELKEIVIYQLPGTATVKFTFITIAFFSSLFLSSSGP